MNLGCYSILCREWASRQQELAQNLSKLILQRRATREISMEGALRQEEEKWQKRIEGEAGKREEAKESMKKQREDAMRVKEERMSREVEDGRAELQHNINLDEAAHREDAERSAKRLQDGKELAQIYLEEMVIGTCEETGIATFAMRKAAHPCMAMDELTLSVAKDIAIGEEKTDEKCTLLPDLPPHQEYLSP
ncbi:hypothetical protein ECG_03657 [Echinococcus granulosus]|nr:hypothetical protein ECG_03657 [Echinococcus granulosus]